MKRTQLDVITAIPLIFVFTDASVNDYILPTHLPFLKKTICKNIAILLTTLRVFPWNKITTL